MGLFSRSTNSTTPAQPAATDAQLREIGSLVNEGRIAEANAIAEQTSDPRGTAFAAFRYIDPTD